jgi:hypothetical protein
MPKSAIIVLMFMCIRCLDVYAAGSGTATTWDTMIDGIKRYSADKKLKEEFDFLCQENDTATIDGRIDTGSGLYMVIDVPVYKKPGVSKRSELGHDTVVVLTGASQEIEAVLWTEIRFMFISEYSETAVSIDSAWIEASYLKKGS